MFIIQLYLLAFLIAYLDVNVTNISKPAFVAAILLVAMGNFIMIFGKKDE